jgi:hypothetical protein
MNNEITKQIKNQASTPRPTQDFKPVQCKLKPMSKIMLKKEWLCNMFEIWEHIYISQKGYVYFFF